MPFIFIKSRFKPTVRIPDGDSVRFLASNLAIRKKLDGTPARLGTSDKSKHIVRAPSLKNLEAIKTTTSNMDWLKTPFLTCSKGVRMIRRAKQLTISLSCLLLLCSCNGPLYIKGAKKFSESVASTAKLIDEDLDSKTGLARLLGIQHYISTKGLGLNDDQLAIRAGSVNDSFTSFVCAGTDKYLATEAQLSLLKTYANGLKTIAEKDPKGTAALWSAIQEVKKTNLALRSPSLPEDPFKSCIQKVVQDLSISGQPFSIKLAADKKLEGAQDFGTAVSAAELIYNAVKKALDFGLQWTLEEKQGSKILQTVKDSKETIEKAITALKATDTKGATEADRLLQERKSVALLGPFHEFNNMMSMDVNDKTKHATIFEMGATIHKHLSDYDHLMPRATSSQLINSLEEAHKTLTALETSTEGISLEQKVAKLEAIGQLLKELFEASEKVKSKLSSESNKNE